ncbi:MAG TPA: hypothetical protein VKR53_21395 [Puia sp.]|nr:hypothetical protein [Puia sp.]
MKKENTKRKIKNQNLPKNLERTNRKEPVITKREQILTYASIIVDIYFSNISNSNYESAVNSTTKAIQ